MPEKPFQLDDLLNSPQAARLLKNKQALMDLSNSPEARKLMLMLTQKENGGLQNAAQSAMNGDVTALVKLMEQIMSCPEGAKVMEGITRNIPQE